MDKIKIRKISRLFAIDAFDMFVTAEFSTLFFFRNGIFSTSQNITNYRKTIAYILVIN